MSARTATPTPGATSGSSSTTPLLQKLHRQYIQENPLNDYYVVKEIGKGVGGTIKFDNSVRARLKEVLESMTFQRFVVLVIVFNAITLGLETSPAMVERFGRLFFWTVNNAVLLVFIVEIGLRFYVERVSFFLDAWNWFDAFILLVTLIPQTGLYNQYAVFRVLRVVRLLRVIKVSSKLRLLTETLLGSLPTLAWFFVLLLVIFYIFALIGTSLFGTKYNEWFGTVPRSMYTLFQIMTLESWSMGISRPVMKEFPYAWLFFVPFILIATYTAINIFMANIVNEMQQIQAEMLRQEGTEIDQLKVQLQRMEVMLLKMLAKQEEDELRAMKEV
jgi:voltage-gated sodium channel